MELLGRDAECRSLETVLADAISGRSRAIVLRGDAGIGKSALIGYIAARATGWRIARAAGVESEMEIPYASLHQICLPVLDHLQALPAPQYDALQTVFGLATGPPPDRFLVGLGTLTLLAEAAEHEPLLCIVEDAQWLDEASAQIIGFVARRVLAERIALVCAARAGVGDAVLSGLPERRLSGLTDEDARALLLSNVTGPIDAAICAQILAESHGNPLALLELPRTLNAAEFAGGFGLLDSHSVTTRIEQSYAQRVLTLPAQTQLLVLTAAAEPLGDPVLLDRAARRLGVDMAAAFPAIDAGLLEIGTRVGFAHPLVRSAIYRTAAADERRRVHLALADATDAAADPDRRAWHRARAASAPDEDIAVELERSASRAQARGGLAAAAGFLTRACELTPDPKRRIARALTAAFANLQAGALDAARRLLASVTDGPLDELEAARAELLRAHLAFAGTRGAEATPLLVAAARRFEPLDPVTARETYVDAFSAALFGARLNSEIGLEDVARAARAAPASPDGERRAADLLLDALVALADGYGTAIPACRDAVTHLAGEEISAKERLRWLWQGCVVALELWDDEAAYSLSQRSVRVARETGALTELALALSAATPILVLSGDLRAARVGVEETRSVEEAAGIRSAPYGALILTAWQGETRRGMSLIDSTITEATARGEGVGLAISQYARAVLCNGSGRYDEALEAARVASEHREVVAENWALPELIEAAARTGSVGLARTASERLAAKARATGTDWALGVHARTQALLAAGGDAENSFRAAIEHLGRTRARADLARARLLYGEWLRRENRRVDARGELASAFDMFETMGMEGFADRTRHELGATGATVRKRNPESRDALTPQEAQIAALARDGHSNPEIGAQLFISPRTVEWHLRKVFTKLGVNSRSQLRTALPNAQPGVVSSMTALP